MIIMADYVVIARFDQETEEKLYALQEHLCREGYIKGISEWPPHITIAAYENIDIHLLLKWTEEFSNNHFPFDIMFPSLGIFPPRGENSKTAVIYASPSHSIELVEFYFAFHEKLDEYCGNLGFWYSKKFGYPVIHSTLGTFDLVSIQKAIELIITHNIFVRAKVIALEVYTYPMELIQRFEL